jgi:hypothetical protein
MAAKKISCAKTGGAAWSRKKTPPKLTALLCTDGAEIGICCSTYLVL